MNGLSSPSDSQALAARNGSRISGFMSNGSDSSRTLGNNQEHRTFVIDSDNNDDEPHRKDKETIVDKGRFALHVVILQAVIDLDDSSRKFNNKHYNVVYWVVPGEELRSNIIQSAIPTWNEDAIIALDNIDDYVFLNVEVQTFYSRSDPGTSYGMVVVGRAKIPITKELYRQRNELIVLAKNEAGENKPSGRIMIGMRLERI